MIMKLLTMLLCKGTCAPVAPTFKGQGGSAPVMHPRSGVPVCTRNVGFLYCQRVTWRPLLTNCPL